jgi:hypothetical protein
MQFETPRPLRRGFALLVEGHCPNGHGPLERRDDHGHCDTCGHGWLIRGAEITMVCEISADT